MSNETTTVGQFPILETFEQAAYKLVCLENQKLRSENQALSNNYEQLRAELDQVMAYRDKLIDQVTELEAKPKGLDELFNSVLSAKLESFFESSEFEELIKDRVAECLEHSDIIKNAINLDDINGEVEKAIDEAIGNVCITFRN